MRQEVQEQLELTREQESLLDGHSLLNLFNILELQLAQLDREIPASGTKKYAHFCLEVLIELPRRGIYPILPKVEVNCARLKAHLIDLQKVHTEQRGLLAGLLETVANGHSRLQELKGARDDWVEHPQDRLRENLSAFLKATESVSKNRFKIEFSPAIPSGTGYWVDLQSHFGESGIQAPFALNDIIRDLVANARKYSNPGSTITVDLSPNSGGGLSLKVSDDGIGIPEDEIKKVVHYGYRATNALDRRTMGGGLGLTKAYQLCRRYGGECIIQSTMGKGTTIELSFFPPR